MENLRGIGLTEDEIEAFQLSTDLANKMLELPMLHPMEREEVCHDVHKIQMRILARPGLRALGWPETDDDTSSKEEDLELFSFLWNEYGSAEPNSLSEDAKILRNKLRAIVFGEAKEDAMPDPSESLVERARRLLGASDVQMVNKEFVELSEERYKELAKGTEFYEVDVVVYDPRLIRDVEPPHNHITRGAPLCREACPFKSECAQHITAGDYRTEGGFTPDLFWPNKEKWVCSKKEDPNSDHGAKVIKNGVLTLVDHSDYY